MMKKIILWTMSACALSFLGFLVYLASMDMISEKVMSEVAGSFNEKDIEALENDPAVKDLIERHSGDLSGVDLKKSSLPITTKEEAVKKISKDFTVKEIREVVSKAKGGFTPDEQKEIYSLLTDRLTEEELTALKMIAIQELEK